jgi:hypothetical protein
MRARIVYSRNQVLWQFGGRMTRTIVFGTAGIVSAWWLLPITFAAQLVWYHCCSPVWLVLCIIAKTPGGNHAIYNALADQLEPIVPPTESQTASYCEQTKPILPKWW